MSTVCISSKAGARVACGGQTRSGIHSCAGICVALLILLAGCAAPREKLQVLPSPAATVTSSAPPASAPKVFESKVSESKVSEPVTSASETTALASTHASASGNATAPTTTGAAPSPALLDATQQAHLQQANDALGAGDWSKAESLFAGLREQGVVSLPVVLGQAQALHRQQRNDAAIDLLADAETQLPWAVQLPSLRGVLLRESGRYDAAREAYLHALEIDSTHAPTHRNLAVLADIYLGLPTLAFRHLDQARRLQADPSSDAWFTDLQRRVNAAGGGEKNNEP